MKLDVISPPVASHSHPQAQAAARSQPPQLIQTQSKKAAHTTPNILLQHDIYVSVPKQLPDGRWELHLAEHQVRVTAKGIVTALQQQQSSPAKSRAHAHPQRPQLLQPNRQQRRRSQPTSTAMARTRKEPAAEAGAKEPLAAGGDKRAGRNAASSELPRALQFPLLLVLNWSLSALLYTVAAEFTAGDLSTVSRSVNEWYEIGLLAAWKVIPLAAGWWGHFDAYDLAAVTFLAKFPTLFLLNSFYGIRISTFLVSLGIDVLSVYLPFNLLRPLAAAHSASAPPRSITNRTIISDNGVQIYTSLFGAAIYTFTLALTFSTFLPAYLVTHFDALTSLTITHDAAVIPKLFLAFIPLGLAAKILLFTPSTSAKSDIVDVRRKSFSPHTAGLWDTLEYNVWGFSKRVRVLLSRTAFLVAYAAVNTFLQCYLTIEGAEFLGALAWSAVWAVANAGVGAAYWWVADVKEVKN